LPGVALATETAAAQHRIATLMSLIANAPIPLALTRKIRIVSAELIAAKHLETLAHDSVIIS
jgi:hypothetical protein